MTRREIICGIDFDEVIYDWYLRAHEVCELAGITNGCTRPLTWQPYEEYGIGVEEWIEALDAGLDNGYLYSAAPMKGAVDALSLLREYGCQIFIITARGNGSFPNAHKIQQVTREYIDLWEIPTDGIFFTADKEGVARRNRVTHAIDDNLENYRAFERAGAVAYLHDQPWNMAPDFPVRRVTSLSEFAETILIGA